MRGHERTRHHFNRFARGLAVVAAVGGAWWLYATRADTPRVVLTGHAEAELVAARDAIEPGQPLLVALRLKAKPGWHTYWRNPGDSGQPTSIEWKLPASSRSTSH